MTDVNTNNVIGFDEMTWAYQPRNKTERTLQLIKLFSNRLCLENNSPDPYEYHFDPAEVDLHFKYNGQKLLPLLIKRSLCEQATDIVKYLIKNNTPVDEVLDIMQVIPEYGQQDEPTRARDDISARLDLFFTYDFAQNINTGELDEIDAIYLKDNQNLIAALKELLPQTEFNQYVSGMQLADTDLPSIFPALIELKDYGQALKFVQNLRYSNLSGEERLDLLYGQKNFFETKEHGNTTDESPTIKKMVHFFTKTLTESKKNNDLNNMQWSLQSLFHEYIYDKYILYVTPPYLVKKDYDEPLNIREEVPNEQIQTRSSAEPNVRTSVMENAKNGHTQTNTGSNEYESGYLPGFYALAAVTQTPQAAVIHRTDETKATHHIEQVESNGQKTFFSKLMAEQHEH